MDFRGLWPTPTRLEQLARALRANDVHGATLLMDRQDTSFRGMTQEVSEQEVIDAVRAVPCHY
jgi:hypothetical protein